MDKLDLQGEVLFIMGEGERERENGGAGEYKRCRLLVRGCMEEYGGVATYVLLLVLVVVVATQSKCQPPPSRGGYGIGTGVSGP